MSNIAFETDISFIEQALNDFLRDKKLTLTDQQYAKLKKLLMVRLLEEEMSYTNAYNHLTEIVEYRKDYEINANAPDEAEEEMIRIIGAADTQEIQAPVEIVRFKKRFVVAVSLLILLSVGLLTYQGINYLKDRSASMSAVITTAEENTLKEMVAQVVALKQSRGNEITTAAIYNQIKKLDTVQTHGPATSYKKFNRAQYDAAIRFLKEELEN